MLLRWIETSLTLNSMVPDLSSSKTCGAISDLCARHSEAYVEDIISELTGVTEWEELAVDLFEL